MKPEHLAVFGCLRQGRLFADELFGAIPLRAKSALEEITKQVQFEAGCQVVGEGEACGIYVLIDGNANARLFNHLNERIITFRIKRNEIFGLPEAIANSHSIMSLITLSRCRFNLIDRDGLVELLSSEPEICFRIIKKFSLNLSKSYRSMNDVLGSGNVTRIT